MQDESNSIKNQKEYPEDFARKSGFRNIRRFTDDGVSGITFEREGFRKMIAEVQEETCAGGQTAVYTRDKAVMRKLDTLVADFLDTYSLVGQYGVSKTYSFPKSYISYCKPRAVSTEQRERARQMMIERNKAK